MAGMQPQDIAELVEVSDPRLSPDGRTVAYVVTTVDLERNGYRSAIWTHHGDDAPPRRLTPGEQRDLKPRWSPDGTRVAFVTIHPDKRRVVSIASADGTTLEPVLRWPDEIDELAWSPDGRRLALSARVRDEARYRYDTPKDQPARRIDKLTYRLDSVGWIIDRPRHVLVVDVEAGAKQEPLVLTPGPFQDSGIAWSPDGSEIVFSSGRHETWDRDMATDLFAVPAQGGALRQLTATGPTHVTPSFSPDGTKIAYVQGDRTSFPRHGQIGIVTPSGGDERLLTTALDRNCNPYLLPAREPVWDGDVLVFQVEDAGNLHLYRLAATNDATPELVLGGDRWITSFDVREGIVAFVATTPSSGPELFVLDARGERQLTSLTESFVAGRDLPGVVRFTATSADGTEVEAWVMRPADVEPGRTYPTILNIHGGPYSQYGNRFFDEFQVQSGAGYAVVYCNPRGSSGYSEAFARAIRGPKAAEDPGSGWGGVDYEDVMAVAEEAVRRFDFIDGDRLAVMGGSYGGYLTSWIIGHSERFAAAVSERALNNALTMTWTSDIGHYFNAGYVGASPLDDPEEFLRQSPITYVRDMTTPVLILHSEDDLRCPINQSEELFVALKLLGKDVEFWRFPGESHELTRAGAPRHRIERAEIILEFLARTLSR